MVSLAIILRWLKYISLISWVDQDRKRRIASEKIQNYKESSDEEEVEEGQKGEKGEETDEDEHGEVKDVKIEQFADANEYFEIWLLVRIIYLGWVGQWGCSTLICKTQVWSDSGQLSFFTALIFLDKESSSMGNQ